MNKFQKIIDKFWQKTIFKILPQKVTPNYFTLLRFVLIPVVLFLIATTSFAWGMIVFFLAALADSIDGALARQRKQISGWGIMLDPLADKMLIILVSVFLMYFYPYPLLLFFVILFDFLMILFSIQFLSVLEKSDMNTSNFIGKAKMVFQSVGLIMVFLFLIFNLAWLFYLSVLSLFLAIVFGFLSIAVYSLMSLGRYKK